ncbi:hypothetical protein HPB51_021539 [Rhipicephalus microplus]|uniref:Uncharacterized protein n=1 Tax=Rhipicephalus microplus TaxID=6941 RepID=A0A9J6EC91_RHIMP|nr:hypothetical protein HPB51_021539 [Rhipicephalus microplus]
MCIVVSPSGNITSEEPLELEEGHRGKDLSGANVGGLIPNSVACTTWNATVMVQGSYEQGTIQATVKLFESKVLQCEKLHVALWAPWGSARPQSIPCVDSIRFVDEEIQTIANLSVVVKFENLSAGNYCVRDLGDVLPITIPFGDHVESLSRTIAPLPKGDKGFPPSL